MGTPQVHCVHWSPGEGLYSTLFPRSTPSKSICPPCPRGGGGGGGQGADTGSWQGSQVGLSITKKDTETVQK